MARIVLRQAGVALVLTLTSDGGLPRIVHWGEDPGQLDREAFDQLAAATAWMIAPSSGDRPLEVPVFPENRYGYAGKPGIMGSRSGRDWSVAWSTTEVLVDGSPIGDDVTQGMTAEIISAGPDLELRTTFEMLPSGVVRVRAGLTNLGEDIYELQELTPMLPVPAVAREVQDFHGRWGKEKVPQRHPLTVGQHRREGRHGRTGFDAAHVLNVGTPGFGFQTGEVWGVAVGFSGNHVHLAERDASGVQLVGGGELLLPGEGRIARGETYETPWIYGNYAHGLDQQAQRFHQYLRSLDANPGFVRPVTLNVWEAVYFDHNLERLTDLADRAADLGVERFVLDDGWFGERRDDTAGLGDWVVSPDAWPDGLHPLIDHVRSKGMEFGLWFEPEMVNAESEVGRAHPEWFMQPGDGRIPLTNRQQHVLNLTIPEAYEHVKSQMLAIFDEYDIAYVKWDHNRDLVESGTSTTGTAAVSEQTRAYYRLLDELREAHPEIEFESCSSGGGRIDLEVLQRVQRVWVSDNQDPEDRQQMLYWTSQVLPPEYLGSHVAVGRSHETFRTHDVHFRAGTAVFGCFGIEWDLAKADPAELEAMREWIAWYKANRDVLCGGTFHRVDLNEPEAYFKGFVNDRKAIFSLTMLRTPASPHLGLLRFPGLDDDTRYRVTIRDRQGLRGTQQCPAAHGDGVVMTGRALRTVGMQAPILQPVTVVLFEIEPV